jgi:hemin uptake protein HemP
MTRLIGQPISQVGDVVISPAGIPAPSVARIKSQDLLQQMREIEIDHEGRIYRLRLTQLNKLILTA